MISDLSNYRDNNPYINHPQGGNKIREREIIAALNDLSPAIKPEK